MGLFAPPSPSVPPHPRHSPLQGKALTAGSVEQVMGDSADFVRRKVALPGGGVTMTAIYLEGMVKSERLNDYIFRPLQQAGELEGLQGEALFRRLLDGALYTGKVEALSDLEEGCLALTGGGCLLFLPGEERAVSAMVPTEDRRSVGESENEPAVKGARDTFVENLGINLALVRSRIRTPSLTAQAHKIGRQTYTEVELVYIRGIAAPETVRIAARRLARADIDGAVNAAAVEEYLGEKHSTLVPTLAYTERPDRFCDALLEGRVGVLCSGLPLGFLLPGNLSFFLRAAQDKAYPWLAANFLLVLRYCCMLLGLFLPALYVAAVDYHMEVLPQRLILALLEARLAVPFPPAVEVLLMLLSFELIQEAGLRLPSAVGQTVSILGGLVVGSAAVEARLISPAVLVVVALAGVAGYTTPNQDLAWSLRLCRLALAVLAGAAGYAGVMLGGVALICYLACVESFGVAWLAPFGDNAGEGTGLGAVLRRPLKRAVLRERFLRTPNRRNQGERP